MSRLPVAHHLSNLREMSEMPRVNPYDAIEALSPGQTLFVRDWGLSGTAGVVFAMVRVCACSSDFVLVKGEKGGVVGITRKS